MNTRRLTLNAAVFASLLVLAPIIYAQSMHGEPLKIENAKREPAAALIVAQHAPAAVLRFQPLAASRIEALHRHNLVHGSKRLQIGVPRSVADEAVAPLARDLAWISAGGGQVLHVDVLSPDAAALRVGLDPRGLPVGAALRVTGTGGVVMHIDAETMKRGLDAAGTYWTPITDGERQRLEFFVPATTIAIQPQILSISHFLTSPLRPLLMSKVLGSSGSCNIDIACRTATLGQAFINAENAVARMVFTTGGRSFTCTGTLLNDSTPATQVPYLYSAAHCLSLQSEADTLSTFWNYESPTCGVLSAGPNIQVSGGADLLFASLSSDALLLRMRTPPPAGAFFTGWNTSTLTPSTPVVAIHHPSGDNKKVSRGTHFGFQANVNLGTQVVTSTARANWTEGTTEGGSSGSGLFTLDGTEYRLRGGLAGGSASCANTGQSEAAGNVDFYSRFDQVFPSLQPWLGATATVGPTRDYTGAWFVPAESGWGLTILPFPGQIFALFFVYDAAGRPSWYRFQGAWTGTDVVTANLDRATGPAWAATFNPNAVSYARIGSATLTFTSATAATLSFQDGTVNRTVTLTKL